MVIYDIFKEDLAPVILAAAQKNKPAGSDKPIIAKIDPLLFNPYIGFEGEAQIRYFEKDAVLKKKLDDYKAGPAQTLHQHMVKALEGKLAEWAKTWKSDEDNTAKLKMVEQTLVDPINQHGAAIQDGLTKIANEYFQQVGAGKLAERKYQIKFAKGFLKIGASLGGVGLAIAAAVGSHGATSPGVILACYGTYKAVKETFDTYKTWCQPIDQFVDDIEKTITLLETKYKTLDTDSKKMIVDKKKIAAGEVMAKAATEFLVISTKSIKSLEEDTKHLGRHVDIGFKDVHEAGKKFTKMKKALMEIKGENASNRKSALAMKKILPAAMAGEIDKITGKLDSSDTKLDEELNHIPLLINATLTFETSLKRIRDKDLPEYKKYAADLKEHRPDWVAKTSILMRLVPVALGAACADMSALAGGGAGMMNEAVSMATGAATELASVIAASSKKKK